ncbi:MAG: DUF4349 domain-containing protein [Actinomycetota bacterium]|nr:DUF4349 domain-containing protein [Actinomycetota bacterium]
MHLGRMAVVLVAMAALAGACSAGEEDSSAAVSVEEPIGAPEPAYDDEGASTATDDVVKSATIEIEVPRDELGSAAQQVVDLATSPQIGGFLVSSVVDTEGYGAGNVLVRVPADRFEETVGDLERVGDVTRQQLEGDDVSPEAEAARARLASARRRMDALQRRAEGSDDAARTARAEVRRELREAQREVASVEGGTAYSSIDVSLEGTPPPPPPKRSTFEQALDTAAAVSAGIASGIVLAAAVVVPVTLLVLVLLVVGARLARLVKPRLRPQP